MTNVLVFGASGFIGRSILAHVQKKNGARSQAAPSGVLRQSDPVLIDAVLHDHQPDAIVQASGLSHHRGQGFQALYESNVMPTVRLAAALERAGRIDLPVYALGSAAELGRTSGLVGEDAPCDPHTDYGRSKWLQTIFARGKRRDGFRISILRLFNVVGVGMNPNQVPRCFVDAVIRGDAVLRSGRLDFQRDYLAADSAGEAIATLVTGGWTGDVLHLCTGRGTTARQLVDEIFRQTGRTLPIEERQDPSPGDYHSVGNPTASAAALGRPLTWSAESCIQELLAHA